MITKINSQCWFAKMIDIDGSVNEQEIKRGEIGAYTPPYAHPQFTQHAGSRRPFLGQDKYCIGATMFDVYNSGLGLNTNNVPAGCPRGDGLFGCAALANIAQLKQNPRFPKGVDSRQNEALLSAISMMLNGKDYSEAASTIEKAFPQIKQCQNPPPKTPNRPPPQESGGNQGQQQYQPQPGGNRGQPQFNQPQPGGNRGSPQFNPYQPGGNQGQPQYNPYQPGGNRGSPQFNQYQPQQYNPYQQGGRGKFLFILF